jgi:1,4-alpha-glucan branching enzyme
MIRKSYSKKGKTCRGTFDLPVDGRTKKAALCSEFNEWNPDAHPMKKTKDDMFSTTVSLKVGQDYRFKYLLDGERWVNDSSADGYVHNPYGSEDSLVKT